MALLLTLTAPLPAQQLMLDGATQASPRIAGLPNLAVRQVRQDGEGYLWALTDGGLYLYDGTSFQAYRQDRGIPDTLLTGLSIDAWGRVWITSIGGLVVGDRRGFAPVQRPDGQPFEPALGPPVDVPEHDRAWAIGADGALHSLRAAPGAGVTAWREAASPVATPGRDAAAMSSLHGLQSTSGALWLGCGTALCELDGHGRLRRWGEPEGVPAAEWSVFAVDRDGRLWARSADRMIVREPGAARFERREPEGITLGRGIPALLAVDPQGRVLTSTARGLARWASGRWQLYTTVNGLPRAPVQALQFDRAGDAWLATLGSGLLRWHGYHDLESWAGDGADEPLAVWQPLRDRDGRLLFGTGQGCRMLIEAEQRIGPCPFLGLPAAPMFVLAQDPRGDLWMAFENDRLYTVARGELQARPVDDTQLAQHLVFDRGGTGWLSRAPNGLARIDTTDAGAAPRPVDLPTDAGAIAATAVDAQGALWLAAGSGLLRHADGRWQRYGGQDAASAGRAQLASVAVANGSVWAAPVTLGLLRCRAGQPASCRAVDDPLVARTRVYSVHADRRGWLWALGEGGVLVFDGQAWRRYDTSDGLVSNDTDQYAWFEDRDGSVWIGTSGGLSHVLDPVALVQRSAPLDLRIRQASFADQALPLRAASGAGGGAVPTRAWQRDAALDVELTSLSLDRAADTEFRWRLVGLSQRWVASRQPALHVSALEPGRYRLELMAVDAAHARQSPVLSLRFDITPPWWRAPWAQALAAVLGAAALAFFWRQQMRRLRAREALVERATRDALTRLWNRPAILDILARELAQARRTRQPVAIAVIDLDHFKRINDTYGHLGGDRVLSDAAKRMSAALRPCDWLGRYGGEELLAVLPGLPNTAPAVAAERLRECLTAAPFVFETRRFEVTASLGVAWFDGDENTDSLIARADAALYRAKHGGRNRVAYAPREAEAEPAVAVAAVAAAVAVN